MNVYCCSKSRCGPLAAATAVFVTFSVSAGEQRQLDAHEHGVATVNMALEDDTLFVELETPAMNIVGFEHPPRTAEQQQAIAAAIQTLETDPSMFVPNAAAQCTLLAADAQHSSDAAGTDDHADGDHDEHADQDEHEEHADHDEHEEHAEHDDNDAGGHAEFVGQYRFSCRQPAQLTSIRVGLFTAFALTEEVEVSFLGPDVQTFMELDAGQPVLRVDR